MLDHMRGRIAERRYAKPRDKGITMVLDKLVHSLNCLDLEGKAPYIDYVKIGWGLPLLVDEEMLKKRISTLLSHNIDAGLGGTLMELAYIRGEVKELFQDAWELGFNIVEISSGIVDIPLNERLELADFAKDLGFKVTFEVGNKNPYRRLSLSEVIDEIKTALESGSVWKVVIEGREFGRSSCIFDDEGNLKSGWFSSLVSLFNHDDLIFEAPLVKQQVELIRRLGPNVNLGNVRIEDVLSLESLRLGIRGDTFLIRGGEEYFSGSPSEKFVLFVLRQFGPMSASEIRKRTGLPARTIYRALKILKGKGLVEQVAIGSVSIWAPSPSPLRQPT